MELRACPRLPAACQAPQLGLNSADPAPSARPVDNTERPSGRHFPSHGRCPANDTPAEFQEMPPRSPGAEYRECDCAPERTYGPDTRCPTAVAAKATSGS